MIDQITLDQMRAYFSMQHEVVAVYLFGSQATGRSGRVPKDQDVDVAVLFDERVDKSTRFDRTLELASAIQRIGHRETDVVDLNSAPILLRMNAIMGKLLYSGKDAIRCGFEVETLRDYQDNDYFSALEQDIRFDQIQKGDFRVGYL